MDTVEHRPVDSGHLMTNYFAGIAVGVIILQTMIFAPTIFKTLEMEPAGKLLR